MFVPRGSYNKNMNEDLHDPPPPNMIISVPMQHLGSKWTNSTDGSWTSPTVLETVSSNEEEKEKTEMRLEVKVNYRS